VEAAIWCVDRVAIGAEEAVGFAEAIAHPRDRPLDAAMRAVLIGLAGERLRDDGALGLGEFGEEVGEAVREVQDRFSGRVVLDQLGRALPADLRAALQSTPSNAPSGKDARA
jgi:hypothetical protein